MNALDLLKMAAIAGAVSWACPAAADPLLSNGQPDLGVARIVLASLNRDLEVPVLPNMSQRLSAPDLGLDTRDDPAPLMQVAGRCGSSNKYCNSPGFTYCCGNSTDGYYCAANVNGCTK